MAKKTAKTKKKQDAVTVVLSVNGKKLTASGDTVAHAILALPKFTPKTTGKLVVIKEGNATSPMLLNILKLKRLFYPGMTGSTHRTVLEKNLAFYAD